MENGIKDERESEKNKEGREVVENKEQNNYISFKPDENEISPRFEIDSKKSKKIS